MPCYDPPMPIDKLGEKMPPVLCGLVRKLGAEKVLELVDWTEAGVSKEDFLKWWQLHQEEDRERKARAAANAHWTIMYGKLKEIPVTNEILRRLNPLTVRDNEEGYKQMIVAEATANAKYMRWLLELYNPGMKPEWFEKVFGDAPPPTEAT